MLESAFNVFARLIQLFFFVVMLLFVVEICELEAKHDYKHVERDAFLQIRRLGHPNEAKRQHNQAIHGIV